MKHFTWLACCLCQHQLLGLVHFLVAPSSTQGGLLKLARVINLLVRCVFCPQIRLQGDAPQLHLLPGAAGPPAGLLPLPGGSAGEQGS